MYMEKQFGTRFTIHIHNCVSNRGFAYAINTVKVNQARKIVKIATLYSNEANTVSRLTRQAMYV
jgi:hypothetical protein